MIKLYLDEDVPEAVAMGLELRGYDVLTVREAGRKGQSDIQQLRFSATEGRAIITFNIADFCKIHVEFLRKNIQHSGIILSRQLPVGVIVKALLKLLSERTPKDISNNVVWLSDWIR